jgi:UDP:flavonoid glycosyltransferase YjiC (YdhE family)
MCPNVPGHLNPTIAVADALRSRGHHLTFFLLGDPPAPVLAAGFEVIQMGGSVFPPNDYRAAFQRLGTLDGRAALKHTLALGARGTEAILQGGPALVRKAAVAALLVDQTSFSGGTVADQLQLPFATVCNALLLNPDPAVPPFFTHGSPARSGGCGYETGSRGQRWTVSMPSS